jgi:hypothetical protein
MNLGPQRWTALARRFDLGPVQGAAEFVARGAMGEVWRLETIRGAWAVKWRFPWGPVRRTAQPGTCGNGAGRSLVRRGSAAGGLGALTDYLLYADRRSGGS